MFELQEIIPWGRSFDEYSRMFALGDDDRCRKIIGCADGPAGFNAEATRRGYRVKSCDPLYRFDADQIHSRIRATYDEVMEQTRRNHDQFLWEMISSVEDLGRVRMEAMHTFLADYEQGHREERYIDAELPHLPFSDGSFDLALCSHFLFLYSAHLDEGFHVRAVRELCRVATEVRIFPLLALSSIPSPFVGPVQQALEQTSFKVSIEPVPYEFQRGANQMMRIQRPATDRGE
jgi:hypothetical protein